MDEDYAERVALHRWAVIAEAAAAGGGLFVAATVGDGCAAANRPSSPADAAARPALGRSRCGCPR
jgi:hypothetical protein